MELSGKTDIKNDKWMSIAFRCCLDAEEWVKDHDGVGTHHFVWSDCVLRMILKYKQLRLSRFDKMKNDPSEGKFASEVFKECITDLFELGLVNEVEADRLKESVEYTDEVRMIVRYEEEKMFRSENIRAIPYVACFTRSYEDCMWNEYGTAGALELKINEESIRAYMHGDDQSRKPIDLSNYVTVLKVRYDGFETRRMVRKLIMNAKAVGDIDRWCAIVHEILMDCRLAIKPAKFKHEKEYRLVYLMPESPKTDDPALRYVCKTHYDLEGMEVVERTFDPGNDGYVWIDITKFIEGVTIRNSRQSEKDLVKLAQMGDRFYV